MTAPRSAAEFRTRWKELNSDSWGSGNGWALLVLSALEAREQEVEKLKACSDIDGVTLKRLFRGKEELEASLVRLREKARALAMKLHQVMESPEYLGVFVVSQLHVGPYTGPIFGEELDALEAELPPEEAQP